MRIPTLALAIALTLAGHGSLAACALPTGSEAMQTELLANLNAERRARNLPALRLDAALDKAAQGHACDNARRLSISHDSADGSRLQHRLKRAGYPYRTAAENTGRGFRSGARAVQWWMNSPHHKDNILLPEIRDIGIGIALSDAPDSRLHWVIDMGRSN
ncbi:MAG: CAP domain-containing protein [Paracoccaceae bacterium]